MATAVLTPEPAAGASQSAERVLALAFRIRDHRRVQKQLEFVIASIEQNFGDAINPEWMKYIKRFLPYLPLEDLDFNTDLLPQIHARAMRAPFLMFRKRGRRNPPTEAFYVTLERLMMLLSCETQENPEPSPEEREALRKRVIEECGGLALWHQRGLPPRSVIALQLEPYAVTRVVSQEHCENVPSGVLKMLMTDEFLFRQLLWQSRNKMGPFENIQHVRAASMPLLPGFEDTSEEGVPEYRAVMPARQKPFAPTS
jgi:hypothetical protein